MKNIPRRYYGLDALRACMMLLGIVFHLAIPYTGVPFRGYYITGEKIPLLQIVLILHYFRMPTFFVLSGFFSALLWRREGTRNFLRIRSQRVGVVWVVALAIETPVITVVSIYNHFATQGGDALTLTCRAIGSRRIDGAWLQDAPLHLWFLEYLMLYCIVAAVVLGLATGLLPILDHWTACVIRSPFRIMGLAIPTAATLWYMPLALVPYPSSFVPWAGVAFQYGWFYAVGWLAYRQGGLLFHLEKQRKAEIAAIPIMWLINSLLVQRRTQIGLQIGKPMLDLAIAFSTALFIWSTVIVLIAAFNQIKPRGWLSYLADASYWIYLAHYPLTSVMPALLREWLAPPALKVALSTVVIFVILLVTYDRFVRYTSLGRALNGVRVRTPVMVEAGLTGASY